MTRFTDLSYNPNCSTICTSLRPLSLNPTVSVRVNIVVVYHVLGDFNMYAASLRETIKEKIMKIY